MISRTQIKFRTRKKTSQVLQEVINLALKTKNKVWHEVAQRLSGSTRQYPSINLDAIERMTSAGDTVIVLGKVLNTCDVSKKVRICALGFSSSVRDKLKKTKSEAVSVVEEIKRNPKAEGVKIA